MNEAPPGAAPVLPYATTGLVRSPCEAAYRAAIFCGAAPLCVGTFMLVGYLLSRAETFAILGFLTIPAGVLVVGVGAGFLAYYDWTARRRGERLAAPVRKRVAGAAGLLIVNFPVAAVYAVAGWYAATVQRYAISNAADVPVDSFVITADGVDHEVGPIPAGGSASFSFRPRDSDDRGDVQFSLRIGQTKTSGPWPGGSDGEFGRDYRAAVGPDGTLAPR